jgi:hypothetical protein
MTEDLRFTEIEHKYVVDDRFDLLRFREALARAHPVRTTSVLVRDRYFLTAAGRERRFVIRHRYDAELHHLTVKTLEADTEIRAEINLDLGHHAGDQRAQVDAFVDRLGVVWRGTVHKDVEVWYFPDCEVVCYQASAGSRTVRCVEFEAKGADSKHAALATVEAYERATGFDRAERTRLSLVQILFPELGDLVD